MDQTRFIAALIFLTCVEAQNTTTQQEDHDLKPLHPSMAVVLAVLSIMFCLTFLILAYAKFCHTTQSQPLNHLQNHGGIIGSRPRFSGVEKAIIESLPFFRFSSLKGAKEGLECAVCLSRFEETELLRLLPKCRHAFHMTCIDKWLEIHSTCPLCRYKFDVGDIKRSSCSSMEEPNFEFFIQREQSLGRSLRFNLANTLQKLARVKRDDPLIQDSKNQTKILHNIKHKIIVSDVMHKSRWSDVNSSDMLSLNSEVLNVNLPKGPSCVGLKEQILKIKEDMERKRVFESKIGASNGESSSCHNNDLDSSVVSKSLDPGGKRSMSEITNISRFTNSNSRRFSGLSSSVDSEEDEKVRRVWLPIARRTIQWFSGQEMSSEAGQHKVDDV